MRTTATLPAIDDLSSARSKHISNVFYDVKADLEVLQDRGRDRLGPAERRELRARYAGFEHPGADEIVRWLDGGFRPHDAAPGT